MHILPRTVHSCEEVELFRADPLKSIASWLRSFASHVLLGMLIMLLTMNQSNLLFTQILDLWNI